MVTKQALRPVALEEPSRMIFNRVKTAIQSVVPPGSTRKITADATLTELEIDSLRVVELTLALERELDQPVFLHDWIMRVNHPRELTVGSLTEFLADTIEVEERTT
jgi:acyl carrier protein